MGKKQKGMTIPLQFVLVKDLRKKKSGGLAHKKVANFLASMVGSWHYRALAIWSGFVHVSFTTGESYGQAQ
jgi:hypothetical protein